MALVINPNLSINTEVGKIGSTSFSVSQLIVSSNARSAQNLPGNGGKRSACRVTMNRSGYMGTGGVYWQQVEKDKSALFFYNPLNLADLEMFLGGVCKLRFKNTKPTTTTDKAVVDAFRQTFGINLPASEISSSAITWTGNNGTFTLTANETSLGFYGSALLKCEYETESQGPILSNSTTTFTFLSSTAPFALASMGKYFYVFSNNSDFDRYATSTMSGSRIPGKQLTGATAASDGERYIYITSNDKVLWRFDTTDNSWTSLAANPFWTDSTRARSNLSYYKGKLYLYGGLMANNNASGVMHCYDIETNTWSAKTAGVGKAFVQTAVIGGDIYVVGGSPNSTNTTVTNTAYKYSIETDTWSPLPDYPVALNSMACANYGNRLYCIGGKNATASVTNVNYYDPVTNTWTAMTNLPNNSNTSDRKAISLGEYLYFIVASGNTENRRFY